jgi:LysM repeat protein
MDAVEAAAALAALPAVLVALPLGARAAASASRAAARSGRRAGLVVGRSARRAGARGALAGTAALASTAATGGPALAMPLPGSSSPAAVGVRTDDVRPAHQSPIHVVRPGECLWSIAADLLGPGASDAEIAAEWPRWYRANRALIGRDPGLIQVGMRLRAPAPPTLRSTSTTRRTGTSAQHHTPAGSTGHRWSAESLDPDRR